MASTYRSPETVVVSEAAPIVNTINSLAGTFLKTSANIKAIQDEKVKQARDFNQRLIKDITIDPTAFYKALGENNANRALFDQVNNLMDENAKLQLDIEAGLYSQSDYRGLMASKNKTISELSQLVGLAESEKTSSTAWVENAEDRVNNLTNQGGDSLVGNTDYVNAKNIFSKMSKGSVERIFKDNIMYYKIEGEGLDKPYEIPATGFLSKQLFKVPNFDKEWANILEQAGLVKNGTKTDLFKNLSQEQFETKIAELIEVKTKGAIRNRQVANSMYVEIFGGDKPFEQYGGGDENHYTGSAISNTDADKFKTAMTKYVMSITPSWEAKAPKELTPTQIKDLKTQKDFNNVVKSWEDKFIRTMGEFEGAFNPEGNVITGELNIFNEVTGDDGKPAQELRPEFIRALSFLDGITVKSTNQDEARISGGGLKGDFTVIQGQPISVFVENLHRNIFGQNKSLYDPESAEKFAYQFKLPLPGS
jgi:hypothetical protein